MKRSSTLSIVGCGLGVLEIIRVAHEADVFAERVLDDAVGSGADRLLVHALRPDLLIVLVRMDDDRACQILDRRRKRPSRHDANAIGLELFRMIDPVDVALRRRLVLRLGDEIQGVDHVVGVEGGAVMKLDALAQLELERLLVDPFPGSRELALVLVALGTAIDQRVPYLLREDHADAHIVEIGIGVVEHLVVGNAQRVVLTSRHRRCRRNSAGRERSDGQTPEERRQTTDRVDLVGPCSVGFPLSSGLRRLPSEHEMLPARSVVVASGGRGTAQVKATGDCGNRTPAGLAIEAETGVPPCALRKKSPS